MICSPRVETCPVHITVSREGACVKTGGLALLSFQEMVWQQRRCEEIERPLA